MLLLKKHHFKFKQKIIFNKHILKNGPIGLKLKYSICIDEKTSNLIKFLILKKIKNLTSKKFIVFFYFKNNFNKTKLPLESRMGKGKGEISGAFSYYKSGSLFLEFKNLSFSNSLLLKNYLNKKLSLNLYLIL
uniref:Ribosomal protein L16 n=1 Tax=Erythrocystis saccata TaxID=2822695 RepID=A0A8E6KZI8_9FLOR|nr:ribosomal protein L16 [Erythrocystis saccata]